MSHGAPAGETTLGLMAFWSDIALSHQAAYQRWHNNEHIPERLSVPGFVRGRRYRSVTNALRFLMYYDTADLDVLTSPAYLARLNAPTPRTKAALAWFQNGNRTAYQLVGASGAPEHAAPAVLAVASFVPRGDAADAAAHRARTLAQLAQDCGALRVREYRLHDAGSSVRTGEASVHNAAVSSANGLLVLHSDDLDLLDVPTAWRALQEAVGRWATAQATGPAPRVDIFSLEFALHNARGTQDPS